MNTLALQGLRDNFPLFTDNDDSDNKGKSSEDKIPFNFDESEYL